MYCIPSWSQPFVLYLQWRQLWQTFVESSAIHSSSWRKQQKIIINLSPWSDFYWLITWLHSQHIYAPSQRPLQPSIFSVSPKFDVIYHLLIWVVFLNNLVVIVDETRTVACLFLVLVLFSFLAHLLQLFWCKFQLEKHLSWGKMWFSLCMNCEKVTSSMFGPLPNILINFPLFSET